MKKYVLISIVLFVAGVCYPLTDIKITDMVGGSEETILFKKVDEGEGISFKASVSGGGIPNVQNLPTGSSYSANGIFSWVPGENQSGLYSIGFYTGVSSTLIYKNLRIAVANTQFRIPAGQKFEYLFMATDPDNDKVELSLKDMPSGATFTGGQYTPKLFSWTPAEAQLGTYTMTLIAQDVPTKGSPQQDKSVITIVVSRLQYEDMQFDFNKDGKIDLLDYSMFAAKWLKGVPPQPTPPPTPSPVNSPAPSVAPTISEDISLEEVLNKLVEDSKKPQ